MRENLCRRLLARRRIRGLGRHRPVGRPTLFLDGSGGGELSVAVVPYEPPECLGVAEALGRPQSSGLPMRQSVREQIGDLQAELYAFPERRRRSCLPLTRADTGSYGLALAPRGDRSEAALTQRITGRMPAESLREPTSGAREAPGTTGLRIDAIAQGYRSEAWKAELLSLDAKKDQPEVARRVQELPGGPLPPIPHALHVVAA